MRILISILLLILVGCLPSKNDKKEYCSAQYQLLNDEIMTTMPGEVIISGNYLVWTDPFGRDYFVHVYDAKTGKKMGSMGKVGEGPGEFISGEMNVKCINNKFFAYDSNGLTRGYLSIDSLLSGGNTFIPMTNKDMVDSLATQYDEDVCIRRTEDGDNAYFQSNIKGHQATFGVYPVRDVKKHLGTYHAYDSESGYFVCTSFSLPYLALYNKVDNGFVLQWERKPDKKYYKIEGDELIIDRKRGGMKGVCMSKDYIITLERDQEKDPMDESTVGRDASKRPHTVFLYDYKSNLQKVVDLGIPIIRITADRRSNTLYAIGVDPDYILVKYEL